MEKKIINKVIGDPDKSGKRSVFITFNVSDVINDKEVSINHTIEYYDEPLLIEFDKENAKERMYFTHTITKGFLADKTKIQDLLIKQTNGQ
jgi:hypothetical protein